MKYINQIGKEGKLTVRKNEDRGKTERLMLKDSSLHQAYVCLHCEKRKCIGTAKCFGEEAARHGKDGSGSGVDR